MTILKQGNKLNKYKQNLMLRGRHKNVSSVYNE